MKVLFLIICIVYSGLTIISGVMQLMKKSINTRSSFLMIFGGLMVLISTAVNSKESYPIYLLVTGLILIHMAAIDNGIKLFGKINPLHHIIRLCISILLIVLYIKIRRF